MAPQTTQRQISPANQPSVRVVAAGRVIKGQGIGISGKIQKGNK